MSIEFRMPRKLENWRIFIRSALAGPRVAKACLKGLPPTPSAFAALVFPCNTSIGSRRDLPLEFTPLASLGTYW